MALKVPIKGIDVAKWLGLVITAIGIIITTVVWAASEHDDLKDDARVEVRQSEKDMKETMKDQFTPLHEFTKIEQKIDDQSKQIEKNSDKIDKIDKDIDKLDGKLDTILEGIGRRHDRRNNP